MSLYPLVRAILIYVVNISWQYAGTPCARLEGGSYTDTSRTNGSTCSLGLPSTINVVDRRYVVDVEYGAVNIFVGFPGLDRASKEPAPDSHLFRVEKGKLRYVHTVSTCEGHPGCGLNGTYVPIDGGNKTRQIWGIQGKKWQRTTLAHQEFMMG